MVTGFGAGSVVAGYRVESRIGAGGMAMVFRAQDVALGRTVALKVLAPALADDAAFRERFIRESRAAAVVDHPHIIPVYGAGEFEGVLYIAMRYVAGGDLRALLRREGPLPPSRAAFLLSPLASALDAGHAAGLVHRDVKPANILIDTSPGRPDHLYLSDFGLAKGNASTGLTGTGQFLGTLEYCAPEQIGGKPARPQTDQYALGCVAYTMLTGTVPFPRDEVTAVLVARAMAKDPDERYPTCAEFADAVRAALGVGAYTTPSSIYTTAGTGLPPAGGGELAGPASAMLPGPVPPSPVSTPPAAPQTVPPAPEAAAPGSLAAVHAATQSGSSLGFADTTGQTIAGPGSSSGPGTGPHPPFSPARRRRRLVGALVAGVVLVAAGGATAAALALSSHNPPAPGASNSPAPNASDAPQQLATLTEPDGATPTSLAFKSDGTLVIVDTSGAYSWDIAASRATETDFASAQAFTSPTVHVAGKLAVSGDSSQLNAVHVWNVWINKVVATLAAPRGTIVEAYALSPDGTEAAVADSNGSSYVWKLTG